MSDSEAEQDDIIQQNEEREEQEQVSHEGSRERSLEPSEPGYDLVKLNYLFIGAFSL